MRRSIVFIILLCIAVLPVSGQSLAHADDHSMEHSQASSDFAENCPLHAAEAAEVVEQTTEPSPEIGQLHDCCDGTQLCTSGECPADCGHCKAPGHGHCATLSGSEATSEQHESVQWPDRSGYHSRTTKQPTPPPNYVL